MEHYDLSYGYCIYVDSLLEGSIPVERQDKGNPVTYENRSDAEREIAEGIIERLTQYLEGNRDFDDAISVEEYVVPVTIYPDGSVVDELGNCFEQANW
jgi:hypothetical protein